MRKERQQGDEQITNLLSNIWKAPTYGEEAESGSKVKEPTMYEKRLCIGSCNKQRLGTKAYPEGTSLRNGSRALTLAVGVWKL